MSRPTDIISYEQFQQLLINFSRYQAQKLESGSGLRQRARNAVRPFIPGANKRHDDNVQKRGLDILKSLKINTAGPLVDYRSALIKCQRDILSQTNDPEVLKYIAENIARWRVEVDQAIVISKKTGPKQPSSSPHAPDSPHYKPEYIHPLTRPDSSRDSFSLPSTVPLHGPSTAPTSPTTSAPSTAGEANQGPVRAQDIARQRGLGLYHAKPQANGDQLAKRGQEMLDVLRGEKPITTYYSFVPIQRAHREFTHRGQVGNKEHVYRQYIDVLVRQDDDSKKLVCGAPNMPDQPRIRLYKKMQPEKESTVDIDKKEVKLSEFMSSLAYKQDRLTLAKQLGCKDPSEIKQKIIDEVNRRNNRSRPSMR